MGCKQPAGGEVAMTARSIVMYATRFCSFCCGARQLLSQKGWEYEEISADWDPAKRVEMVEKAGRPTVPQIWISTTYIGGCDELLTLERSGQLDALVMGASDE